MALPRRSSILWLGLCLVVLFLAQRGLAVEVGEKAPDFALPSTTGKKISLDQFKGKKPVLIEFYVADFGATWVKNLEARKADYSEFQGLNIQVLGIAAASPFSQKTFADSLKLPYPLLSDFPDPQVIRNYGVLRPYPGDPSRLVATRSFFLIDEQGVVRGRWIVEDGIVFPNEPILEVARKIAKKS